VLDSAHLQPTVDRILQPHEQLYSVMYELLTRSRVFGQREVRLTLRAVVHARTLSRCEAEPQAYNAQVSEGAWAAGVSRHAACPTQNVRFVYATGRAVQGALTAYRPYADRQRKRAYIVGEVSRLSTAKRFQTSAGDGTRLRAPRPVATSSSE
jgi:hypothetical protein